MVSTDTSTYPDFTFCFFPCLPGPKETALAWQGGPDRQKYDIKDAVHYRAVSCETCPHSIIHCPSAVCACAAGVAGLGCACITCLGQCIERPLHREITCSDDYGFAGEGLDCLRAAANLCILGAKELCCPINLYCPELLASRYHDWERDRALPSIHEAEDNCTNFARECFNRRNIRQLCPQ